jgi:hypothetical protein
MLGITMTVFCAMTEQAPALVIDPGTATTGGTVTTAAPAGENDESTGTATTGGTVTTAGTEENLDELLDEMEERISQKKNIDTQRLSDVLAKQAKKCSENTEHILVALEILEKGQLNTEEGRSKMLKILDSVQEHNKCGTKTPENLDADEIMTMVRSNLTIIFTNNDFSLTILERFRVFLVEQIHRINTSGNLEALRSLRSTLYGMLDMTFGFGKHIRRYHFRRLQQRIFRHILGYRRARLARRRAFKVAMEKFISIINNKIRLFKQNNTFDLHLILEIYRFIDLCIENRFFNYATRLRGIVVNLFASIDVNFFNGLSSMTYYDDLITCFKQQRFGAFVSLLISQKSTIITTLQTKIFVNIETFITSMDSFNSAVLTEITAIIKTYETDLNALEEEARLLDEEIANEESLGRWLTIISELFPQFEIYHQQLAKWINDMSIHLKKLTGVRPANFAQLYAMLRYMDKEEHDHKGTMFEFKCPVDNHRVKMIMNPSCNKKADEAALKYLGKTFLEKFANNDETKPVFDAMAKKMKDEHKKVFMGCCACPVAEAAS